MPQMVIDICRQHHGTTLMKFFYVKAKNVILKLKNPTSVILDHVHKHEAGIVSIADTCEAAVRAMDHPTNEKFKPLCIM